MPPPAPVCDTCGHTEETWHCRQCAQPFCDLHLVRGVCRRCRELAESERAEDAARLAEVRRRWPVRIYV